MGKRVLKERTGVGYAVYGPGPVSDEIAALITNPDAWIELEDDTPEDEVTLDDLNVKQLKAAAAEAGIDVPSGAKKADIIALLEE